MNEQPLLPSQAVYAADLYLGWGTRREHRRAEIGLYHPNQSHNSLFVNKSGSDSGLKPPSRELRQIGEWAEELLYRWLIGKLKTDQRDTVDWVAQRGETPGWDISYMSESGAQIHVEVKATTLRRFSGIDITANEWRAAQHDRECYVLALVTRAMSTKPNVALLWNPAEHAEEGGVVIEPTGFRLTARGDA